MKKSILLLFAALLPLVASAEKVEIDGIWYNLDKSAKQAEVTFRGDYYGSSANEYSGSITIPATVTYYANYSVTSIGEGAFQGCSDLTDITLPENVTSIGDDAFSWCSSLTDINIPEDSKLKSIGDDAFRDCSSLESITIPEGVTSIGERTFYWCSSLTTINIPEDSKLTSIGDYAFRNCRSLTAITIPDGVTSIGDEAFYYCISLTTINIPESVTSIGDEAFYKCYSLKTVINYSDLPLQRGSNDYGYVVYYADRVINIDEVIDGYAFKTIEGVHYLTGYIGDKTELTLPADYKGENYQIGERAFYNCYSLTSITIPEGVTSIGDDAFEGCSSLESLHIGPNVDSYGDKVFEGCTTIKELTVMGNVMPEIPSENLTSITLHSPIPLVTKEFAAKVYRNATLNIPENSLTRYENADVWKNFWYINGFDPKEGTMVANTTARAIKVQGHRGTLRITGTTQGEAISVYTTDGMLVTQESAEDSETILTLPTGQVYIVKVADKVVKIGM